MAQVVALVDNLFFQTRILDVAKRAGVAVKTATTTEQFLAEAQQNPTALLLVDLDARDSPVEAVERLRAAGGAQAVIGFLSHIEVELAARARAAGCQQVLSRFEFTQYLPSILSQAKAAPGAGS
jgi:ActR/RegA family two-component response regulator